MIKKGDIDSNLSQKFKTMNFNIIKNNELNG